MEVPVLLGLGLPPVVFVDVLEGVRLEDDDRVGELVAEELLDTCPVTVLVADFLALALEVDEALEDRDIVVVFEEVEVVVLDCETLEVPVEVTEAVGVLLGCADIVIFEVEVELLV